MKIHPFLKKMLPGSTVALAITLMSATLVPCAYADVTYTLNGEELTSTSSYIEPTAVAGGNELTIANQDDTSVTVYGSKGAAEASGNRVNVSDSSLWAVFGGSSDSAAATGNQVTVTNSTLKGGIVSRIQLSVCGGHSSSSVASGNVVNLTNSSVSTRVYGGWGKGATGNYVYLTDSVGAGHVYGGYSASSAAATGNYIIAKGSGQMNFGGEATFNDLRGGRSESGAATDNHVIAEGMYFDYVMGGDAGSGTGAASGNTVTLKNCTVNTRVYGAQKTGDGDASGNTVLLEDSTVYPLQSPLSNGRVYGGFILNGVGNATNNTVILKTTNGGSNFSEARIYGGGAYDAKAPDCDLVTGNTLVLDGFQGAVKSVANFEKMIITLRNWNPEEYVLSATETMDLSGMTITLENIESIADDAALLTVGEELLLFSNYTTDEETTMNVAEEYTDIQYGKTRMVDLKIELDEVTGMPEVASLTGRVTNVRLNPQLKALSEGRVAALTFTRRAGNLVAEQGMAQATHAAEQEGTKAAAFFSMSAGHDKVDSGSHVDADGVATMLGASVGMLRSKALTLGGFVESGWGQYTTHNSFADVASVRGTGESSYFGAGVLLHYDCTSRRARGLSVDASLRAGKQDTDFSSFDVDGEYAGYDLSNTYISGHIGVGYTFKPTQKLDTTIYARYLWSHIGSDHAPVGAENMNFEAMDSNRLRFGARAAWKASSKWTPYAGFAYEWECSGAARATVGGDSVAAPSMRGGSLIGELGTNWQPWEQKALWLHGSVQGSVGKTQGFGAGVGCTIAF